MNPKSIVSFDSHLDISWASKEFVGELFNLPFLLKAAFLRAYVHFLLRRVLPNVPLYLVIPTSAYQCQIQAKSREFEEVSGKEPPTDATKATADMLNDLGIKLFLSPPKNMKYLYEKVNKHTTVIDIDVDYMQEFQSVCYTKAPQFTDMPEQTHLGKINDVLRTINKIRPDLVLISEAKLDQIKNFKPPLGQIIDFLKRQGYKIELGELASSDKEALKALMKVENFEKEVMAQKRKRIIQSEGKNYEIVDKELRNSLKQLVKKKTA
jgi:hypothetical protein